MDATDIQQGRLYDDLADLMSLISPPEDYAEEAAHWRMVLREKLGEGRHALLELGVGGGHNLSHLTADFAATAVDLSKAMLDQCRRLNPGVELHRGDMRNIRLGRTFAAVLIHDAISYLRSEADLLATFQTAAVHLEPGGVLIASPDRFAETFRAPEIEQATHADGNRRVTYLEYTYDPDPDDTEVETILLYLIEAQGHLRLEPDRHVTGLFPRATWIRRMTEAGFVAEIRSFPLATRDRSYELLVGVLR
ncbi:MAG: class I SAM-dependent methyltransferase [Candidatus Competibacteraceae bacterium]